MELRRGLEDWQSEKRMSAPTSLQHPYLNKQIPFTPSPTSLILGRRVQAPLKFIFWDIFICFGIYFNVKINLAVDTYLFISDLNLLVGKFSVLFLAERYV